MLVAERLVMVRSTVALILLVPLAQACGGATQQPFTTAPPDGGTVPEAGSPDAPFPDSGPDAPASDGDVGGSLEGSYDLTFGAVMVTPNGATPPTTQPPSPGTSARLDIRAHAGGGYEAVLTPRWGDSSAFTVAVAAGAVQLSGAMAAAADVSAGTVDDSWTSFTLARSADGSLAGSFAATGTENVTEGDEGFSNPASTTGTLARDTTRPEAKPALTSPGGPPGVLLPWDPVRVSVAEPVDPNAFVQALSVSAPSGPAPFAWGTDSVAAGAEWAGAVQATGLLKQWDPAVTMGTLSIGSLVYRVGNAGAASASPLQFMTLLQGQTSHSFDSDVVTVGYWGSALTFLGGLTGSDPSCEHGGCVQMGAFAASDCPVRLGIAGLLAVPNATTVQIRYRVLANPSNLTPGSTPFFVGPPFVVDIATPGVDATTTAADLTSDGLKQLPSPVLGMSWGTDWTTFQGPVARPAPVVGFAVRAGESYACGGGLPVPPIDAIVLVDSVSAQ
jgi:hypothetical protein